MKDSVVPYIIGKGSPRRELHGHNKTTNGATATVYVLPDSHSAVVAFSNAADAGDAAETAAQMLLQALFDTALKADLLLPLREKIDRTPSEREDINKEWRKIGMSPWLNVVLRSTSEHIWGLAFLAWDIGASKTSPSGLAIVSGEKTASNCELEHYNIDAFTFLPMDHKKVLARGMVHWDHHTVDILRFERMKRRGRTFAA